MFRRIYKSAVIVGHTRILCNKGKGSRQNERSYRTVDLEPGYVLANVCPAPVCPADPSGTGLGLTGRDLIKPIIETPQILNFLVLLLLLMATRWRQKPTHTQPGLCLLSPDGCCSSPCQTHDIN